MHSRIEEVLNYIDAQRRELGEAVELVPPALRDTQPGSDRWSVAQVLQHLTIIETRVGKGLTKWIADARDGGLGPEIQGVAGLAALETVKGVVLQVGGEAATGARRGAMQGTGAALLAARRAPWAEAEQLQAERQPGFPILHSLQGYQYCDLLLGQGCLADVLRRAEQTLTLAERYRDLLDRALDHLSLGRARPSVSLDATNHLDEAVKGLRLAGRIDYLPLGLLARAANFRRLRDFLHAQKDLNEVAVIVAQKLAGREK